MTLKRIFIILLTALILIWIVRVPVIDWWLSQPDETRQMQLGNTTYQLEIADSFLEQRRGLMGRTELASDHGMYFQFTDSKERSFWMKDTLIPLDLIWVNQGVVTGLTLDVQPEPGVIDTQLRLYGSPGPADAVIELNTGQISQNGLKIGDTITFDTTQ
jgi:uncharacterized membrane protein (UPF0127 family)